MRKLWAVILGVGYSPGVVAAARAFLLLGIPALVAGIVAYLQEISSPAYASLVVAGIVLIRAFGEGLIDQINKATQNSRQPNDPAGLTEGKKAPRK